MADSSAISTTRADLHTYKSIIRLAVVMPEALGFLRYSREVLLLMYALHRFSNNIIITITILIL